MFCMNPLGGELWSVATGAQEETGAGAWVLVPLVMVRRRCAAELRRGGASCTAPLIGGEGASHEWWSSRFGWDLWAGERRATLCRSGEGSRRWACGTQIFCQRGRAKAPKHIGPYWLPRALGRAVECRDWGLGAGPPGDGEETLLRGAEERRRQLRGPLVRGIGCIARAVEQQVRLGPVGRGAACCAPPERWRRSPARADRAIGAGPAEPGLFTSEEEQRPPNISAPTSSLGHRGERNWTSGKGPLRIQLYREA
ncbi:hypothetical protein NDU88_012050 [Pleurodeles waltl]|uniref:Uncharacterized protein n=1 Tax=Pleurodeles waltl TaxID=8319 RepID=A0AAV7S5H4_PLEWA|nr:hypothetical protein NDU88_012050 [Pleurodeles waltl]